MKKTQKTNVARLLDKAGIAYELVSYDVDETDLSATHVAEQMKEVPEKIFKTLVLSGNKTKYFVCVVPGNGELNLKKAAKASGNKNCDLVPQKDLLSITGYIRGGCSPIGMKKQYPTYIHNSCLEFDFIYVSAGQRGLQVKLAPDDLIRMAGVEVAEIL